MKRQAIERMAKRIYEEEKKHKAAPSFEKALTMAKKIAEMAENKKRGNP